MNRIKKAPGGNRGGGLVTAEKPITIQRQANCNTNHNCLSSLLDFSLARAEHHEFEARFYRQLAADHEETARRHRAVLASLQRLIPRSGGAA